jgi:hypothetical protein
VNLLAGIFAGAAPKTTGVGVFADISNLINQNPVMLASASTLLPASQAKQTLVLKAVRGSSRQESKLFKKLYKLHQKRTLLSLE